jgi:hypothetical protein
MKHAVRKEQIEGLESSVAHLRKTLSPTELLTTL